MNPPVIPREEAFLTIDVRPSRTEKSFANHRLAVHAGGTGVASVLEDLVDQDWEIARCEDAWLIARTPYTDVCFQHSLQTMPGDLELRDYGGKFILLQRTTMHTVLCHRIWPLINMCYKEFNAFTVTWVEKRWCFVGSWDSTRTSSFLVPSIKKCTSKDESAWQCMLSMNVVEEMLSMQWNTCLFGCCHMSDLCFSFCIWTHWF